MKRRGGGGGKERSLPFSLYCLLREEDGERRGARHHRGAMGEDGGNQQHAFGFKKKKKSKGLKRRECFIDGDFRAATVMDKAMLSRPPSQRSTFQIHQGFDGKKNQFEYKLVPSYAELPQAPMADHCVGDFRTWPPSLPPAASLPLSDRHLLPPPSTSLVVYSCGERE